MKSRSLRNGPPKASLRSRGLAGKVGSLSLQIDSVQEHDSYSRRIKHVTRNASG